ncbi:MAG: AzlD domain-containing protein [Actinomycetota bacterium]|nr:AzlD domain-containing protein [Actinomycetota bacterium]
MTSAAVASAAVASATVTSATVWWVVALCALVTFAAKGLGPAAVGARELPAPVTRVVVLLASALLTALVVTNALADGSRLHVGADTAGVAVAALLAWRRAPVLLVVVVAAAVTAALRLLGVDR